MITLNDKETINYSGGAKISTGFVIFITSIASFILGIIDGISNPKTCNLK